MLKKLIDNFYTRINYFDLLKSKNKYSKTKINLGWCSVFPPTRNGTAAASYYIVKELFKREDINLFIIPYKGKYEGRYYPPRLDKRIFKNFNITKIDDPKLDLIILFLLGPMFKESADKVKVPFIIWQTLHDSIKERHEKSLFEKFMLANCRKIFLTTKATTQEYKSKGAKEVYYFPLGVNKDIFKPHKKDIKDFTVLFIGRVLRYKGIIPFLKSIPMVLKKCSTVKFSIHMPFDRVFKPDREVRDLVNFVKTNYPDNFSFDTQWTSYENVSNIYKDADLLVFPSNNEGFGVPLVEAMMCGIPAIVLDKPPMNEIIKDNYNGFCLDLDSDIKDNYNKLREGDFVINDYMNWAFPSAAGIAEKIIYLYNNKDVYNKFSENAYKESEKFALNNIVNNLAEHIKECVKDGSTYAQ